MDKRLKLQKIPAHILKEHRMEQLLDTQFLILGHSYYVSELSKVIVPYFWCREEVINCKFWRLKKFDKTRIVSNGKINLHAKFHASSSKRKCAKKTHFVLTKRIVLYIMLRFEHAVTGAKPREKLETSKLLGTILFQFWFSQNNSLKHYDSQNANRFTSFD